MNNKGDDDMEAESRLADLVAKRVVSGIVEAARDKKTASEVMDIWGGEIDRTIGRGLRRALWYLFIALAGLASVKFGFLDKLMSLLKP